MEKGDDMHSYDPGPNASCLDNASSLKVVAEAVQQVMKKRDTQHFGRVLEFLELLHEQVPDLLCYRHHAKLSLGVKGKMVLDMVEKNCSLLDVLKALNRHFPVVYPDDPRATRRDLLKVHQCNTHFRRLVLCMMRDEKFRKNYMENELQNEYGENFMTALEKLLEELLQRLQAVLAHQVSESVAKTAHKETSGVETDNGSMGPAPQPLQENCSQQQDDPYASNIPNTISSEDSALMKNVLSNESGSAETEKSQRVLQAQREIGQSSAQHQSCRKGSQTWRRSEASKKTTEESRCSEKTVTAERRLDTDLPVYDSGGRDDHSLHRSRPVFDIFGLDCSVDLDVDHFTSHSPPNPFQSQETGALLERHPVLAAVRGTQVCEGAHGLQPESNVFIPPRVAYVSKTTQTDHGTATSMVQVKKTPHDERYLDRRTPRTNDVRRLDVTGPLVRHPMSWKYQPVVQLTRLPPAVINAQTRCQDFAKPATSESSEEDSQATNWTDTESWRGTCSVSTDNLSSDPDYDPGCLY
ncbi:uncharacterized protein LOC128468033 [Spea bombifrons]|uniref:uncharacterized protein LOC128468033 n=1 Tax=Spea bombifrons TaxID=233779 RepID=UPI00234AABC8|nr:uncharacterized protein LOC128468033 [Spea bombifrons]